MTLDFDVGVIGAGCIGAGIAAALTDGQLSVALIDQGSAGASARSGGVVRLYDPDPRLMTLAAHAIARIGKGPCGLAFGAALRRTGVLYRAALDDADDLARIVSAGAPGGHPLRIVSDSRVTELSELACGAPGRVNLYEPQGGIGDVKLALRTMIGLARRHGTVIEQAGVEALDLLDDGRVALKTGGLRLRCRVVVLAGGAWSARLLPGLGIETRSIPLARLLASRPTALPVIDATAGSYAIPLAGRLVHVGSRLRHAAATPEGLPAISAAQAADAADRLARLSGRDERGPVIDVLAGFDAYSPDGHPLVGFAADDSPLYLATAMCGLGYKFTPAVADIARRQIVQRLDGAARPDDPDWDWLAPARLGRREPALAGVQP